MPAKMKTPEPLDMSNVVSELPDYFTLGETGTKVHTSCCRTVMSTYRKMRKADRNAFVESTVHKVAKPAKDEICEPCSMLNEK